MESWRKEFYASDYGSEYLAHYGIRDQRWGVRRFQNPDGTLTQKGKERYRKNAGKKLEGILDDDGIAEPNGWPEVPAGEEVDLEKRKNEGLLDDDGIAEPNGWPEVPAGKEVDLEKRKAEREADARRNAKVAASSPRRSAEKQVILDRISAEQEAATKKKAAQSELKKIDRAAVLDQQSKEYGSSVSRTSTVSSAKNTSAFAKGINFIQSIFGKIKRA